MIHYLDFGSSGFRTCVVFLQSLCSNKCKDGTRIGRLPSFKGPSLTREEEAERRQVRRRYNDLKQRVKNRRFQQVTDLSDVIKETDELLEEVERKDMTAREAVLDANVFKLISTRCREQAQVSK